MAEEVIDMHVHFGAPEDVQSGCYWSSKFEGTPAFWFMKITSGSFFTKFTKEKILKKLLKVINKSVEVDKCVLLAMDEVYDENGKSKPDETHLYVPNSYIVELADKNDRILFGSSIHPYRKDWQDELEKCMENGACLCKWIPSSQQIDPTHVKCESFYRKLTEYKLPLLIHCGPEYAIPTSNTDCNENNNPKYLRKALDMGVTVIIAHCSLPYFGLFDAEYFDDMEEFYKLFADERINEWKLYADLSALATPLRSNFISGIINKIPHDRLVFGSDYPIPASELSYKKSKNIIKWIILFFKALSIKNPLDKNYHLVEKMGFDKNVFTNASKLFDSISR
ncbi:MAG: amidohydrolase family protein [Ignavibacteria bacterium]|nr:amidohydrolase family protein [Ignavibacteria bacterium]